MSLTVRRTALAIVVLGFLGYTVVALRADGWGFFTRPFTDSTSGSLIISDLMVELTLLSIGIHYDSRRRGRNPWAWIAVTMTLGAVGSAGYLLARTFDTTAPALASSATASATDRAAS